MSFTFNPTGLVQNQLTSSKVDFINKYGNLSLKYDRLTATGEQKHMLFYIVPILLVIASIFCFAKSTQQVDANNEPIERTSTEKILRILAWISLGLLIVSTGYSGYMYFMLYLPQYKLWFNELPLDAKNQLNLIGTLNAIASTTNNTTNQRVRTGSSGLINIQF